MQVILLERIGRLGQMGDVVNVKDGYARNFLLPLKKALRATDENRARFESQRSQLEARDLELKKEAEAVAIKLAGKSFLAIRQAGDTGQLYGSVTPRDLAEVITAGGFSVDTSAGCRGPERPRAAVGAGARRVLQVRPERRAGALAARDRLDRAPRGARAPALWRHRVDAGA